MIPNNTIQALLKRLVLFLALLVLLALLLIVLPLCTIACSKNPISSESDTPEKPSEYYVKYDSDGLNGNGIYALCQGGILIPVIDCQMEYIIPRRQVGVNDGAQ